jgi:acetylornithine deacetylase/succinyl-diaminopimelate desuccinylase-like protein
MTTTAARHDAIALAQGAYDSGAFLRDLDRRVGFHTESQEPSQTSVLRAYLEQEIAPTLQRLGFETRIVENPAGVDAPVLLAHRHEADDLPTVVTYGHGDVVRGYDDRWRAGLKPWSIVVQGDRWYGRGTADNKGQHSINLAALEAAIGARGGKLGCNVKVIFETGEEIGSPGLDHVCATHREYLAGDLFLASDGPRVSAGRPTVFLGSRGELTFELEVNLREGGHHSGNWGGALRSPSVVLAHAIASMIDRDGRILVEGLLPPPVSDAVRAALADIELGRDDGAPAVDPTWGEPGLTPTERVLAWNALEVLAFKAGNPDAPVNAIPPSARAHCQLRFVVGTDWQSAERHLVAHFARVGIDNVTVKVKPAVAATRLELDNPWVAWTLRSIEATTGKQPALIPNLGGTVPNAVFAETLGLPTVWVPHSYPACSQHAPNEHLLGSVAREALGMMAGLWWDLGEGGAGLLGGQIRRKALAAQISSTGLPD